MSTLAVNSVTDANGGNTATINSMTPTADSLQGFRNRIINGDMRIDQRNSGASVNMDSNVFPVDRWESREDSDGSMTAQRSTAAPAGFSNSILVTTTTADASLSASQYARVFQSIEGFNVADLGWGTASAKSVTISFWVRSSLTGTFGGALYNGAFNRSYPFTYTISSADTWEYKTVTIAGDTSGTWLTNNGIGLGVNFGLGTGSDFSGTAGAWTGSGLLSATGAVSVIGTLNATWYITGVQLEVGSVATPFERRPYGTELVLCQRYYYKIIKGDGNSRALSGYNLSTTQGIFILNIPVSMRTSPTALETNSTAAHYSIAHTNTETNCNAVPSYNDSTINTVSVIGPVASGLTAGQGCQLRFINASAYLAVSAEL
jgi:hypothetical protein